MMHGTMSFKLIPSFNTDKKKKPQFETGQLVKATCNRHAQIYSTIRTAV